MAPNNTSVKVTGLLVCTVAILCVVPLVVSYFLVSDVLDDVVGLGVNQTAKGIFQDYQRDLRLLRTLNPENEAIYKEKFFNIENSTIIREDTGHMVGVLKNSYLSYFIVLVLVSIIFTLLITVVLSKKIVGYYHALIKREINHSNRLHELRNFDQWQRMAGQLAHEIKNPLTPIEMMVGNLYANYHDTADASLKKAMDTTYEIVNDELAKLKTMVNHFSEFSKLPEPQMQICSINDILSEYEKRVKNFFPRIKLIISKPAGDDSYIVVDRHLIFMGLNNLLLNAQEANLELPIVNVEVIAAFSKDAVLFLDVINQGESLDGDRVKNVFDVDYSTGANSMNMGLGLPIVKKIMLDHGGDVECLPFGCGAHFRINLPLKN